MSDTNSKTIKLNGLGLTSLANNYISAENRWIQLRGEATAADNKAKDAFAAMQAVGGELAAQATFYGQDLHIAMPDNLCVVVKMPPSGYSNPPVSVNRVKLFDVNS